MILDYTVSIGTLVQLLSIAVGGGAIYGTVKSNMGSIKTELGRLADVPLTLARHDERLKSLEKGD